MRMRVAMKLCEPPTVSHDRGKAGCRDDTALLTWLASLWRRRWGWTQRSGSVAAPSADHCNRSLGVIVPLAPEYNMGGFRRRNELDAFVP